jgi:hypothetical protein
MNPRVWKAAVVLVALALAPLVMNGTASLFEVGVNSVSHGIKSFFDALFGPSDAMRMEALIKLAVGLVVVTLIASGIGGKLWK